MDDMDDIDDLLDEVEEKFCSNVKKDNSRTSVKSQPVRKTSSRLKDLKKTSSKSQELYSSKDDLDEMINDIFEDDGLDDVLQKSFDKTNSISISLSSSNGSSGTKCFCIYVGGTKSIPGAATTSKNRTCDQLHCTSCDNKIVSFNNYRWEKECDYLDFRNNYPDFERLKHKLIPCRGSRAYCCQCSWFDIIETTELKSFKPNLKWICCKH